MVSAADERLRRLGYEWNNPRGSSQSQLSLGKSLGKMRTALAAKAKKPTTSGQVSSSTATIAPPNRALSIKTNSTHNRAGSLTSSATSVPNSRPASFKGNASQSRASLPNLAGLLSLPFKRPSRSTRPASATDFSSSVSPPEHSPKIKKSPIPTLPPIPALPSSPTLPPPAKNVAPPPPRSLSPSSESTGLQLHGVEMRTPSIISYPSLNSPASRHSPLPSPGQVPAPSLFGTPLSRSESLSSSKPSQSTIFYSSPNSPASRHSPLPPGQAPAPSVFGTPRSRSESRSSSRRSASTAEAPHSASVKGSNSSPSAHSVVSLPGVQSPKKKLKPLWPSLSKVVPPRSPQSSSAPLLTLTSSNLPNWEQSTVELLKQARGTSSTSSLANFSGTFGGKAKHLPGSSSISSLSSKHARPTTPAPSSTNSDYPGFVTGFKRSERPVTSSYPEFATIYTMGKPLSSWKPHKPGESGHKLKTIAVCMHGTNWTCPSIDKMPKDVQKLILIVAPRRHDTTKNAYAPYQANMERINSTGETLFDKDHLPKFAQAIGNRIKNGVLQSVMLIGFESLAAKQGVHWGNLENKIRTKFDPQVRGKLQIMTFAHYAGGTPPQNASLDQLHKRNQFLALVTPPEKLRQKV